MYTHYDISCNKLKHPKIWRILENIPTDSKARTYTQIPETKAGRLTAAKHWGKLCNQLLTTKLIEHRHQNLQNMDCKGLIKKVIQQTNSKAAVSTNYLQRKDRILA